MLFGIIVFLPENDDDHKIVMPLIRLKFPFLWNDIFKGRAARMVRNQPKPMLLNSFKAHVMPISGLTYIDEAEILISSSVDFTVRMWTLSGRYMQTFGTFKGWKTVDSNPKMNENFDFTIPPDIYRVASSTTLRVLRGGKTSRKLSFKDVEQKLEKDLTYIDPTKIYGERLKEPFLGKYYKPTIPLSRNKKITFDISFPKIPVYQHISLPEASYVHMADFSPTIVEEDLDKKK